MAFASRIILGFIAFSVASASASVARADDPYYGQAVPDLAAILGPHGAMVAGAAREQGGQVGWTHLPSEGMGSDGGQVGWAHLPDSHNETAPETGPDSQLGKDIVDQPLEPGEITPEQEYNLEHPAGDPSKYDNATDTDQAPPPGLATDLPEKASENGESTDENNSPENGESTDENGSSNGESTGDDSGGADSGSGDDGGGGGDEGSDSSLPGLPALARYAVHLRAIPAHALVRAVPELARSGPVRTDPNHVAQRGR